MGQLSKKRNQSYPSYQSYFRGPKVIYFIQAEGVGHIKIGFTDADDVAIRLATLQTGSPVPLRLLAAIPGTMELEKDLHRRFASARAHGEWFRPVPELLALINPTAVRSCDGIEVAERSVSIRVLTVGRKQFTRSLLDQLPEGAAIDWARALAQLGGEFSLTTFVRGDVWGWVAGGEIKRTGYEYAEKYTFTAPFRWVIFEADRQLQKCRDFLQSSDSAWWFGIQNQLFGSLYPERLQLPGFRDQDQLFIGV